MSLVVSSVVRKNLERAFIRSTNKLEWFENLRRLGVSQDFYEYVIEQIRVPTQWLVEDIKTLRVKPTPHIRAFLKNRIQVVVPGEEVSTAELQMALEILTPHERQEALVSRFLVISPTKEILTNEVLSLLWEIRESMGRETIERWAISISEALKDKTNLSGVERKWAEYAWSLSSVAREHLSPMNFDELSDSWPQYLEDLLASKNIYHLAACLPHVADERLKIKWIQYFDDNSKLELATEAIKSLKDEFSKTKFLARLYLLNGIDLKSIGMLQNAMKNAPVVQEEIALAEEIVTLFSRSQEQFSEEALEILTSAEDILDRYKIKISDARLEIYKKWQSLNKIQDLLVRQWNLGNIHEKEKIFLQLVELSKDPQFSEETQRLFVDFVLKENNLSPILRKVIETLLSEESHLRIKHLRREFIEKAIKFDPLHREVLRFRSQYDFRSVLVWKCFYDEPLKTSAPPITYNKRAFHLWKTCGSLSQSSTFSQALRIYDSRHQEPLSLAETSEDLEKIAIKLSKLFGKKQSVNVYLSNKSSKPLVVQLNPDLIVLRKESRYLFDDETLKAFLYGYIQLRTDFDSGLFQSELLNERFFLGMLLSGIPLSKMIRFLIGVYKEESASQQSLEAMTPESLIASVPLLRDFLSFYLSDEFEAMVESSGISLS